MYREPNQRPSIRLVFARTSRDARVRLRLTQRQVADSVGVSRGYIAAIEGSLANPSLDVVDRISRALGLEAELVLRPPLVLGAHGQRDLVHARCTGYVERRLRTAGWRTAREVELILGRSHGWIDVLAFHPRSETLLVIEIKTRLDDLGAIERHLGWYGRSAGDTARRLGWQPRRITSWLLVLASDEVEGVIRHNSDLLARAFPLRARAMLEWLSAGNDSVTGRGLAMLDPASKRREWLTVPCRRPALPRHLCRLRQCRSTARLVTSRKIMATGWSSRAGRAWRPVTGLLRYCEAHLRDRRLVVEVKRGADCRIRVATTLRYQERAPEPRNRRLNRASPPNNRRRTRGGRTAEDPNGSGSGTS